MTDKDLIHELDYIKRKLRQTVRDTENTRLTLSATRERAMLAGIMAALVAGIVIHFALELL